MEITLALTAFAASVLTFFSGFGLGTVLMPVMLIWFPAPVAIALTGVVHFANSLFKVSLTSQHVSRRVFFRFGIPAVMAAFAGSWLLIQLGALPVWYRYRVLGIEAETGPMKILIALLLMFFVWMEYAPRMKRLAFSEKLLPVGGILSGFFGGLTGNQGALRSAFLMKAGLTKEQFVGTAALISVCVDFTRVSQYVSRMQASFTHEQWMPLVICVFSALTGALLGKRLLQKTTFAFVQQVVAFCLMLLAVLLATGLL